MCKLRRVFGLRAAIIGIYTHRYVCRDCVWEYIYTNTRDDT